MILVLKNYKKQNDVPIHLKFTARKFVKAKYTFFLQIFF